MLPASEAAVAVAAYNTGLKASLEAALERNVHETAKVGEEVSNHVVANEREYNISMDILVEAGYKIVSTNSSQGSYTIVFSWATKDKP